MNYTVIAQSASEIDDVENAPAVSMGPYLAATDKTDLLGTLSVYTQKGDSREQIRLLYMNATALRVWRAMGKQARLVGAQHRPPHVALLAYGVPFSK
ncbi:MAG TPA: hypothetical protein VK716_07905 [Terracidiphilus sp.]|nr:hypothetical protein [Terracidiphilus sp.]